MRSWNFWFLYLGLPHVRHRNESRGSDVFWFAGGFAGIAGQHFAVELVCHLVARARATQYFHALCAGFYFFVCLRRFVRIDSVAPRLAAVSTGDDFITGHFHLVMGVAATFAILAALFYWFPKMFGRRLNENLGKVHFWLTFTGVYCVFMPMHWLGLMERAPLAAASSASVGALRTFISVAALLTLAAQAVFFLNFIGTLWSGERVVEVNPWRSTTLEWMPAAFASASDSRLAPPVVYRGAYAFDESGRCDDFIPQYVSPEQISAPEQVIKTR